MSPLTHCQAVRRLGFTYPFLPLRSDRCLTYQEQALTTIADRVGETEERLFLVRIAAVGTQVHVDIAVVGRGAEEV